MSCLTRHEAELWLEQVETHLLHHEHITVAEYCYWCEAREGARVYQNELTGELMSPEKYWRTAGGTKPWTVMGYELTSDGEWTHYYE